MRRGGIKERYQFYKSTGKLPYKNGRIDEELMYRERMKDVARENYERWGYNSPADAWQDAVNDPTYDYRGYYSDPEFQNVNANSQTHWPDRYKTPFYPTFSSDSKYHGKQSEKNPYGLRGGQWVGDKFIPAAWQNPIRIPHYAGGRDGELPTDAIQSRQMPIELQQDPLGMQKRLDIARANAANVTAMQNQAQVGTKMDVSQQLQDHYKQKYETARWAEQHKALEDATDQMMLGVVSAPFDPVMLGSSILLGGAGSIARSLKSAITASKLYKGYKISKAINKTVKQGLNQSDILFPGQVGWAPKTTVGGYHASNEEILKPNFWFNGYAQQRGAVPGFYIAGGETPSGGFLSKRPYVHQVETQFDKPMVQVGDIPTTPGFKNATRNVIEQQARNLGADGMIYQDIRDNQLKHQHIAKTLNPDVTVNVRQNLIAPTTYEDAVEVGDFGGNIFKLNRTRGKSVKRNANGVIYQDPKTVINYRDQNLLPPQFGADAFVNSDGSVNIRKVVEAMQTAYKMHPTARKYKDITNSSGNLYEHIRDVVRSAQLAPVPEGSSRRELVQAALFHDIGKIIDPTYNGHAQASLDLLNDLGIDVSPEVARAIKVHMRGSSPAYGPFHGSIGEESPLSRALHFVDVVRNKVPMGNAPGQAYYEYRNLLYPTKDQYKINSQYGWDTDYQLKNIINPILNAYGYNEIELGLPPKEARRQLIQRIQAHRRFVRGQHGLGDVNNPGNQDNLRHAIQQFVDREGRMPTTDELYQQGLEYFKARNTKAGTRGANSYMHKMELPWKHYMSLYTSNSSDVPLSYVRGSSNRYAIGALEMPVLNNPDWSLSELWGYNDYPVVYSPYDDQTIPANDFNSEWRHRILPFVLDHGTNGRQISTNPQEERRRFLEKERPKIRRLAEEEYDRIKDTLKPLYPSDIDPSDFMQAVVKGLYTGSYHFRPAGKYSFAQPVPAAPFSQNGALVNTTDQKLNDQYFGYYNRGYLDLNDWENMTAFINKELHGAGISSNFQPYVYSKLDDKSTVIKYPRAFDALFNKISHLHFQYPVPPKIPIIKRNGVPLPPDRQYLGMTVKQIESHNKANTIRYSKDGVALNTPTFDEDGNAMAVNTKYVPSREKVIQKYLREYFRDIKLARKQDAFVRRAVANYRNFNRRDDWVNDKFNKEFEKVVEKYDSQQHGLQIPKDYQSMYPFQLWSKDGFRVFITEYNQPVGGTAPENYIFVGKRGEKALKLNTKFNFNDTGKRYGRGLDHIGRQYRGLTKNAR